jgi:NlpC/P60 family putative phage cell wall peptidase
MSDDLMGRADVVVVARGWIGTPYQHQASLKGVGSDCLGLLRGVWRELLGEEPEAMPPYTVDWSEARGDEVMLQAARRWLRPAGPRFQAGDVVVFRMRQGFVAKHLGIVSLGGAAPRFIHAYTGHGVVENALTAPWVRRIAGHFVFPKGD